MKSCNWLNIEQLTKYHSILQMYKTIHWGIPTHIKDRITVDADFKLYTKPARLIYHW